MARRLILLLLAVVMLAPLSYAEVTSTFGDQNSSGEYRVKAEFDGTSGYVTYAADTGIKYPYERYTSANTNNTLLAAESGKVISDTGGGPLTGGVGMCSKHILPTAAPGLEFTFVAATKCTMTVDTADTSDTIEYSISGTLLDAGDSIKSTAQAGDSVTVFSTVANKWQIKAMKGTWTDNSTN